MISEKEDFYYFRSLEQIHHIYLSPYVLNNKVSNL
jgi:hypothetical protein